MDPTGGAASAGAPAPLEWTDDPAVAAGPASDTDLAAFVERWRGPLVGFAAAQGASDPAALAQDTLAEAWIGRDRFRGAWDDEGATGAWLRGIARNLVRAERRQRSLAPIDGAPEPIAPESAPDHEPEEDAARVRAALARLPEDLRQAVLMHHLEGTPVRRVAALLGVNEKAVEGRLYRARRALARMVSDLRRAEDGTR